MSQSPSLIDRPVRRRSRTRKGLLALVASGLVVALGAAPASAEPVDGRAFGVAADVVATAPEGIEIDLSVEPTPAVVCPPDAEDEVVGAAVPGVLTAGVLTVTCTTTEGVLTAEASVAEVNLLDQLTAELVTAECTANGGVSGSSSLLNAFLGEEQLDLAPDPNTVIDVPGVGTVTLNRQQTFTDDAGNETIRVDAIVVELDASVLPEALPPELVAELPPELVAALAVQGEIVISSVFCTAAPDDVDATTSTTTVGGTGTTAPPPPVGELPRTGGGSSTGVLVGLGLALVGAGALSLAASRRARGSHTA